MTTIYFVRHAQADTIVRDQITRPLTAKGINDSILLSELLMDKNLDAVLSSPYKRAVDTVANVAKKNGLDVQTIEDFRGIRLDSRWISDYRTFFENYWQDFSYKYLDGESLFELQERYMPSLNIILNQFKNKNIVISTHSVPLAVVIHYYNNAFGFEEFLAMADIEPWVIKMNFNDRDFVSMKEISLPWLK